MQQKIIILILAIFSLSCLSFSQESNFQNDNSGKTLAIIDRQIYYGGDAIDAERFMSIISSDAEAQSDLSTAKVFNYTAYPFSFAGGFCVGYGVVALLQGDTDIGTWLTLGGAGSIGIALLLTHIANSYLNSAIEIFNSNVSKGSQTQISFVPTPQGGLALAFSF